MSAPIAAQTGKVSTQAKTILPATPQRTEDLPRATPTPAIAPAIVCVVDIGVPRPIAMKMVMAPPSSAQAPCVGRIAVIREPIVCTMRQPPINVPIAIAA